VDVDGARYLDVAIPHAPQLLEAGAPAVPFVTRSLAIPDGTDVTVQVLDGQFADTENVKLISSKGNLLRTVDPATVPYTFGRAYQTDAFYPGPLVESHAPYVLRDVQGVAVAVYPVQFNPATGTLRLYSTLTIEVLPHAARDAQPTGIRADRTLSRAFYDLYKLHFINYDQNERYAPLDETGNMLVICYDAWLANMGPFVNHKNGIGLTTTLVGVATIGNTATAIKSYIQNLYNTTDLAFVLLVGDAAQVATPTASGGSSDPSYALLAGGDSYPDILVGRFSAETAAHVDTQVLRSVEYEDNAAVNTPWFHKGTGIGSEYGAGQGDEGQADYVHIGEIRTWLLGAGYTQVDEIYGTNGGSAAQVTAALNQGRGIINYCGHGSQTSWGTTGFSNSNVAALVNDNMLPFIISVACVNGQFAGATCFAEAWLRSTHNGEPIGAVGTYMSSINQSWAPPMEAQDEFNLLLTNANHPYHCYGTLCYAGSCSMIDHYGAGGVEMYNTWHIFGDPSLKIVGTVAPPTGLGVAPGSGLNAEGPHGGPFTPSSLTFTLQNFDAWDMPYEVTKTAGWLTITNGTGTIPAGGQATVTVAINGFANGLGNGPHSDTLAFANNYNHDGDTTRPVALTIGVPTMQFSWPLDTSPGWTISGGQWAFGHPTGGGGAYGAHDPNNGHTGTNVYGYNLAGDYANSIPEYHLTTTAINCSTLTNVRLKFWRWLGVEQPSYDHTYVRVSNNGTSWTTVWQNDAAIADASWQAQDLDISAVASNHATVYVRWTMGTTDSSVTYCGWNIDDVEIWGLAPSAPDILGDTNCDGVVSFDDINPFVLAISDAEAYFAAYPNCNILRADCNGDGLVDFDDINPFVGLLSGSK
jgi:hypothetical protein